MHIACISLQMKQHKDILQPCADHPSLILLPHHGALLYFDLSGPWTVLEFKGKQGE